MFVNNANSDIKIKAGKVFENTSIAGRKEAEFKNVKSYQVVSMTVVCEFRYHNKGNDINWYIRETEANNKKTKNNNNKK